MTDRHSGCPLCGGKLSALDLLDAGDELVDAGLGVVAACCPYCQGRLEIRPLPDRIDIGYLVGSGQPRFDVAFSMGCPGLAVVLDGVAAVLRVHTPRQHWEFLSA
jgi:hypothetical protein